MRKYLLSILLFSYYSALSAQHFIDNHLLPGIETAEYVFKYYMPNSPGYTCPPKISKPKTDTLFDFLDRLVGDNNALEGEILQTMMDDNCRPYYSCRALNDLYLPVYHEVLQKAGLSGIYSMLPIALSGSNPGFNSPLGKAGSWQLSYIVGRKFGLRIDDYFDERKDVTLSTKAAVNYLQFLNQQFNGNHLLVITAFYTSVPYVKKRIVFNSPFDAARFIRNLDPDVYGFLVYLNTWNKWYRHFKSADAQKQMIKANASLKPVLAKDTLQFEWIAKVLSMDVTFIEVVNPAYHKGVLLPGKQRVPFYLPEKKAELFNKKYDEIVKAQSEEEITNQKELAELENRMRKGIPDPKTTKAISYTVQSGDVLGIIAQRYGVRVSSIKQWNNLRSDRINIGQELVIYVSKNRKEPTQKHPIVADKEEIDKPEAKPGKGNYRIYTVKSGESLWLIARKFPGVSSENIMQWNGINDKISPGQKLKIYQPE